MRKIFQRKKGNTSNTISCPDQPPKNHLDKKFSDIADLDDIYNCFRLILGRPPSTASEWIGHSNLVGRPLKDVVSTYITSKEFKERDLDYVDVSEIAEVELQGFSMLVPKNDPQVGVHIYEQQEYEGEITNFIRKHLKAKDVFLDIGANIGYFASLAASIVGAQGKVVAIEPGVSNTKFLMLNKQINQFDQLEIISAAAADKKGLLLYDSSASNGFIAEPNKNVTRVFSSNLVNAVIIDEVCQFLKKVSMIKIDIEGAEYLALKGANNLIREFQPIIVSEFSPPALKKISKTSAENYLHYLLNQTNYEMYYFLGLDLIHCGRDAEKVIQRYEDVEGDHIDVVFAKPDQLG